MKMTYVDKDGERQTPIMGCYGIGVGRLAAAVCEAHHDEYGPIWPKEIAPWQVHLCAVRPDNEEVKAFADDLYEKMPVSYTHLDRMAFYCSNTGTVWPLFLCIQYVLWFD